MKNNLLLLPMLSLCGVIHAIESVPAFNVVTTDFDKVLTITSTVAQIKKTVEVLGFKYTVRGLLYCGTSLQMISDIIAAFNTNLKDSSGRPVIGFQAYVNHIFKDMPFVSEEKKQQLRIAELEFKPNVELIEYYQYLQNTFGMPIYVWTDNDEAGYLRKLQALNAALEKLGKKPFVPNGFHCAKLGTTEPGYSKIDPEYFRIAYKKLAATHGETVRVLFLDDKLENVESALKAAKDPKKLNLDAIVYDSKKTKLKVVEEKMQVAKAA